MLAFRKRDATRRRYVILAWMLAVLMMSAALTLVPAAPVLAAQEHEAEADAALQPLIDILQLLQLFYYRDVDIDALVEGAIQGALEILDDPHTTYFDSEALTRFQEDIDGRYSGVGMTIRSEDSQIVVVSPISGSPADQAGLRSGDVIVAVDGQPVAGLQADAVAARVRGPEGSQVRLTIARGGGAPFDLSLTRRTIELQSIEVEIIDGDIGYIRIIQFRDGVGEAVQAAQVHLQRLGMQGIVLDLRNNPGGFLHEAVAASRAFVPAGPIVHVVTADRTNTHRSDSGVTAPPVAVLMNRGSASASEILAAAIRENQAGFLVGARSYGKATVQSIADLSVDRGLKLTTAEYLTPLRNRIEGIGLEPDLPVTAAEGRPLPELAPLSGRWPLAAGDRGLEVQGLQERLNWLGYNAGVADGIFGARTAAALRAFQTAGGHAAHGRLDAVTFASLQDRLAAATQPASASGDPTDPVVAQALQALRDGYRPAGW
ncbi:MAG: S41 family peptidase [Thermaerobacterales bacterium]